MVKSKKLLSLFLAVVMVLSVFTVMASAYTRVETEGTADIDIKYTVEKVDSVPETSAGSAAWSADNIYAVSIWMKSAKPVDILTAPVHYNKTLFAPITLSDGDCTYPYGAGLDQDTYYTDMTEGAIYAYTLGDYMNNTGMYKANGTTATTKALAKCIGLGNSNSEGMTINTELVSPDHPLYNKWGAGLSADTGVVYFNLDVATKSKTAYLNTIEGVTTSTDWNKMFTLYFESITDEDVTGAEFGVFTDNCFTVDGNYDGTGSSYFAGATSYDPLVPTMNVVSNAVVEAAKEPSPVVPASSQIRFTMEESDGAAEGTKQEGTAHFDIRTRAMMTTEDFEAIVDFNYETKETNIEKVGFVYADSSVGMTLENAAKVIGGTAVAGYVDVPVEHIQKKADGYYWTCLLEYVEDIFMYEDAVDAVGYIVVDGETYFFDEVSSTDFSDLYDTWYEQCYGPREVE